MTDTLSCAMDLQRLCRLLGENGSDCHSSSADVHGKEGELPNSLAGTSWVDTENTPHPDFGQHKRSLEYFHYSFKRISFHLYTSFLITTSAFLV